MKGGILKPSQKNTKDVEIPKFVSQGLKTFSEYFGHKIDVKISGGDKGKIVIPFHSEEDFNRIKKLLQE